MHNKNITNINTLLFSIHFGTADLFYPSEHQIKKYKFASVYVMDFKQYVSTRFQIYAVPDSHAMSQYFITKLLQKGIIYKLYMTNRILFFITVSQKVSI